MPATKTILLVGITRGRFEIVAKRVAFHGVWREREQQSSSLAWRELELSSDAMRRQNARIVVSLTPSSRENTACGGHGTLRSARVWHGRI